MGKREAQLDMLSRVLAAGEADTGVEDLPEGEGSFPGGAKHFVKARRTQGSMGALTGAQGRLYMVSPFAYSGLWSLGSTQVLGPTLGPGIP